MFLSIQADFQLSTMQIGLNWKIALKWTFFINLNALKAIILCIFGVGMCPESLGQKKIFEIFFVTFTMESTGYIFNSIPKPKCDRYFVDIDNNWYIKYYDICHMI